MVEIREVTTQRQKKAFVRYPFKLYKRNDNWVPDMIGDELDNLDPEKNPAFKFCTLRLFLAYRDDKIVGRIAGLINRAYNEKWGVKRMRFCRTDFIDDDEVVDALFDTVENWAREEGLTEIHGPIGFSDFDKEGMLIEGFDIPTTIVTLYNAPYYKDQLERRGYAKEADWVEYQIKVPKEMPEKVVKFCDRSLERYDLKVLNFDSMKDVMPYVPQVFDVTNEAYADLYGTVPFTPEMVDSYVDQFLKFINPRYVKIIVDKEGKVVAYGLGVPSMTKAFQRGKGRLFPLGLLFMLWAVKRPKVLDLYLVAIRKKYQGKGINAALLTEFNKQALEDGIAYAEANPELETNSQVQAMWKYFETKQVRRRRCFVKTL
jgi:GNAT superfamily N-acetyltransferase